MRTSVLRALVLLMLPVVAGAATFTPLGALPGGVSSVPFATSADGAIVVGESDDGTNTQAFSWTGGVMTGLGFLGDGSHSSAQGVSADGSVVVGASDDGTNTQAFSRTGGVMTGLGTLAGDSDSSASDVSADGAVVVGASSHVVVVSGEDDTTITQAFRWTGGTMTGLGTLDEDTSSIASAVSADGAVVVGESSHVVVVSGEDDTTITQAFRWTGGVMTGLGTLPGGSTSSAFDVSADGSVVVGESDDGEGTQAFLWTAGGMTGLGFLPDKTTSSAKAVSADGTVVVGQSGGEAFIWTEATGMQRLASVLIAGGATGLDFATLSAATGISADGLSVVGLRGTSAAFVASYVPGDLGLVPEPFAFTEQADVDVSTEITSDAVTISGITGATPVTVYNGEYSIGCGDVFTSDPGTINDGETVCVRHTSAPGSAANTNTILTVGGVSAMFTSRTGGSSGGTGPSGSSAMDGLSLLTLGLFGLLRRKVAR